MNMLIQRNILAFLLVSLVVGLAACQGMVTSSLPQGGLNPPPAANSAEKAPAAAAPLDVMSAPADDDGIQSSSGQTIVHFGLFFGPNFDLYFQKDFGEGFGPGMIGKENLLFLVNVAESPEGCHNESPAECFKWLDPNLLKNWPVRAYVTSPKKSPVSIIDEAIYYCLEAQVSEKKPEGYNLSLQGMGLEAGDLITIVLYNEKPSAPCGGAAAAQETPFELSSGKGIHRLATFEILEKEIIGWVP